MLNMIQCSDEKRSHAFLGTLVVVALSCAASVAEAQSGAPQVPPGARVQQSATTLSEAPVFLLPDETREPLRTLPAGTSLAVLQVRDDWVQVTWNDAQFGRRTGWIQQKLVRLSSAQSPDADARPPAVPPTTAPRPQSASAPAPRGPLGIRGFGIVGFDKMSASESFNAITGGDTVVPFGGGVQITNLWQGLFVEAAIEQASRDGERVFVGPENEVFPLEIPLEITMRTVDLVAGWRSPPAGGVTSFGGGGVSFLDYDETSEFAEADENVTENYTGFIIMGGVEYAATQWVHIRGEVRYRRFNDALGVGGVSQVFDETSLGGFGVALKVAVGR
jgi:opacity protein-like surface antigen